MACRADPVAPDPRRPFRRGVTLVLCAMAATAIVGVAPVRVAGQSMQPTLGSGNHILTLRHLVTLRDLGVLPWLPDPIQRGAIVTARDPGTGVLLVKRVVALGGDSVGVADGRLVVNGKTLRERYVDYSRVDGSYFGPVRVPAGSVFLLGDNRGDSRDSRDFGPVRADEVAGEVLVRLWPLRR